MIKRSLQILIALLILQSSAMAQDVVDELSKINGYYAKVSKYEAHITQMVYADALSKTPIEHSTMSVKIFDELAFYDNKENVYYQNEEYRLMIDHESKKMMLSPPNNIANNNSVKDQEAYNPMNDIGTKINRYLESCGETSIVKVNNKISQIKMTDCTSQFNDIRLFYKVANHQLTKIEMITASNDQNKRQKVVIAYQSFKSVTGFDSRVFYADKYIVKSENGFKTNPTYSDYEIIDLRSF